MKRKLTAIFIALLALAAAAYNGFLLFFQKDTVTSNNQTATSSSQTSSTSLASASSENSTGGKASSATSSSQSTGLTDGTYTGAVTSTNRGDYQVQLTVSGGSISDISILQYPNDNPQSQEINDGALPTYVAEAISNQSAQVNQISGATEAYKGFTGSLQDALNQAS
ncbi:FMN-binding protein [Streptococcus suis]|uniref:FMN-binding protein n=1 Tax=Streptococcus suis TaxID=1307 RepID=UPI000CF4FC9A|nr:FMN-binding protein [Streptococcus suis]